MSKRNKRGRGRQTPTRPADGYSADGDLIAPLPGAVISGLTATHQISYSGPIPPPHFLREYDEIIPGAAERILALAEAQTHHRIKIESTAVNAGVWRSYLGLAAGYSIGMTTIIIGGVGMFYGHEVAGFLFGAAGMSSLVGVFIVGKHATIKERVEKSKAMKRR